MRKRTAWLLFTFCLLLSLVTLASAADFAGLVPGVSKKKDADRVLGKPVAVILGGSRYDYEPEAYKASRISIQFDKHTRVIMSIDIYPKKRHPKSQIKKWFKLGESAESLKNDQDKLVEYYLPQAISLHYDGPNDSHFVKRVSHFDPALLREKKPDEGGAGGRGTSPARRIKRSAAYYAKASEHAFDRKDYREMKRVLDEAIHLHPDSPKLWREMIRYYFKSKLEPDTARRQGALKAAVRLITLDPSDKNYVAMGWVCHEMLEDCSSALFYYERAWKSYAVKIPSLYFRMGQCYKEMNQLEEAEDFYKRFLGTAPNHRYAGDAQSELADVRFRIKEYQDPEYKAAMDKLSLYGEKQTEGDYLRACKDAFKRKDYHEMKLILDEGTHFYPESYRLFVNLVRYYLVSRSKPDEERIEEALKAAAKVLALDPSGKNYVGMGWVCHEMLKDYSSALFYYQRASKTYAARRPDLYFYMAQCYEELDHLAEAGLCYRLFLHAAPAHKHADEARRRLAALGR